VAEGKSHGPLSQHLIQAAVAVSVVATALPGGGFGSQFRAGAALLVWWLVVVGLLARFWPRGRVPRSALVAGAGLLGLALLSALSMGWASDDGGAFAEAVRVAGYLGLFALVVVSSAAREADRWLTGLAIGLAAVAALAVGSRVQPSLFPDQDLVRLLPSVSTRLSYPLNYWNGLGACMALSIVLLAGLGAHARTRAGRAAAVAWLPVPALALFLTSSRGGVLALAVGLAVLLAVGPARARALAGLVVGGAGAALLLAFADAREAFVDGRVHAAGAAAQGHDVLVALVLIAAVAGLLRFALDRPLERLRVPRGMTVAVAAGAAVALVVALAAAEPGRRIDDFKEPPAAPGSARGFVARHLASAEGNGRYQFWSAGIDAFDSEPLRGVGAGGYADWWARHGDLAYYIRNAHSLFVEVMAELGVLGLLALLVFLLPPFYAALRAPPRRVPSAGIGLAALACGSASAAIDWTWQLPAAFAPVVVVAAVLTGPASREPAVAGVRAAPGRRGGLGRYATIAAGCVAAVAAGILLVAEVELGGSRDALRAGRLSEAAQDARRAGAIEPWAAAPRLQLALVRERAGDLRGARSAVHAAIDRDPDGWEPWLVETRLATRLGDIPAARRALRRVRTLNPRSPLLSPPPDRPTPTGATSPPGGG
jgi:O-antigen ligase